MTSYASLFEERFPDDGPSLVTKLILVASSKFAEAIGGQCSPLHRGYISIGSNVGIGYVCVFGSRGPNFANDANGI